MRSFRTLMAVALTVSAGACASSGAIRGDDLGLSGRGGRDVPDERFHERLFGVVLERLVVAALEPDS